jgi:hypothetical protein
MGVGGAGAGGARGGKGGKGGGADLLIGRRFANLPHKTLAG